MKSAKKLHINIVAIGQVDSGKSTTLGRLIYECGGVDEETMDKLEIEASEIGKGSFKYAWIFDTLKAERERGITIEISHQIFETPSSQITLIDVPGHRRFFKNMLTGASQADCALVVVSADEDEFETCMSEDGQLKDHLQAVHDFGIKEVIVVVNKMDSINWSEDRFANIVSQVQDTLKAVSFWTDQVPIIPISGWNGDNLTTASTNCPWYHGWTKTRMGVTSSGTTLLDAINSIQRIYYTLYKPLRIPIERVYNIGGIGTVPVGTVSSGTLRPGMSVTFAPSLLTSEVKSIEMGHKPLLEAGPGDNIGFNIGDVDANKIKPGYVAGDFDGNLNLEVMNFLATIVIINHPGSISSLYTPIFDFRSGHVACKITSLIHTLEKNTNHLLESSPASISQGERCIVQVVPCKPIYIQSYNENPCLGRFVIRDLGKIVGVGVVKTINYQRPDSEEP